jgi:hypothetical protein
VVLRTTIDGGNTSGKIEKMATLKTGIPQN